MSFCARPFKRPVNFRGLLVHVEVEPGERKSGVAEDGTAWERVYTSAYGEIVGTEGADQDPVDCYLGPDADSPYAFVVRQQRADGSYDEDKCMLGYSDGAAAEADYRRHGPPWGFSSMTAYPWDSFVRDYLRPRPPRALFDSAGARQQTGKARYGS